MNLFFLQIDTSAAAAQAASAIAQPDPQINFMDLLSKGGVLMIPLGILFVIAIFVFFERLIYIRKASRIEENFMNIIRDNIVTGNVKQQEPWQGTPTTPLPGSSTRASSA